MLSGGSRSPYDGSGEQIAWRRLVTLGKWDLVVSGAVEMWFLCFKVLLEDGFYCGVGAGLVGLGIGWKG